MEKVITRGERWGQKAKELFEVKIQIKQLKQLEEKLHDELVSLSDHKSSQAMGYQFILYIKKGNVDYSAIPVLKDINLDQYRKEDIPMWKLNFNPLLQ